MHNKHKHLFLTLNRLHPPKVTRMVALMVLFAILLLELFLTSVPWVQNASGRGSVTALNPSDRQQEINAFVSGRIQEWFVRDGSHVKVGDPIVQIVDNDPNLLERLQAERQQVMARLQAAEANAKTAAIDARRTKSLYDDGLAARREYEQAKIKLQEHQAKVAEVAAELTRVDVKLSRQSVQVVRAPRDGIILRVNAGDESTFVSTGDVVATFVPDNVERIVELYIDGRDISLVRIGDKVRLQFEGWPAVQFSGWPSVAIGTFGGVVFAMDPSAQENGLFRILVKEDLEDINPWPSDDFVRFGSIVRGWVLLETVVIGYELWRQYNNFPPEFRANAASTASP